MVIRRRRSWCDPVLHTPILQFDPFTFSASIVVTRRSRKARTSVLSHDEGCGVVHAHVNSHTLREHHATLTLFMPSRSPLVLFLVASLPLHNPCPRMQYYSVDHEPMPHLKGWLRKKSRKRKAWERKCAAPLPSGRCTIVRTARMAASLLTYSTARALFAHGARGAVRRFLHPTGGAPSLLRE